MRRGSSLSFQPIQNILKVLEEQPEWETQREYRRLVDSWNQVVDSVAAQNSRPVSLGRQTLWIATSNSVWAQTLTLKRFTILQQLEVLVPNVVKELRFSSANWYNRKIVSEHPSVIVSPESLTPPLDQATVSTPQEVFQNWTKLIQQRGGELLLCPQCQSPTPPGELTRWSVCAFCMAKEWSKC